MTIPVAALEAIPPQGLDVAVGEWARSACGEGLEGEVLRVAGMLRLVRQGRRIRATGALDGAARVACDRCGALLPLGVAGNVDCVYVPLDELARSDAGADDDDGPTGEPETSDEGEYDGVALDLRDVVREFFALERPPRLMCADLDPAQDVACLARFRADANLGSPQPDPRFAALKNLKISS